MAKRTIQRDPELLAHQQWLGYLQPVGLVVAPAAMQEAGWVVTRSGSELIERQERYREALEALGGNEDGDADHRVLGFSSIETLLVDHLGWSGDQIQSTPNLIEAYTRELSELGETLQPTALVPAASGEGVQLLVQELPLLTPLDQKFSGGDQHWRASSQERFERLLRETGVEAGLLFNGSQLRLVVAPKGESSGHLTFTLKDLAEVSGRLMFSGLDLLLGQSHVFLDPDGYRLVDVLNKSRSYQAVVSNALADQVLAALWDLLRGFERADQLSQQQGTALLGDIPDTAPEQLYGGLITVLMRLVFLLYAEDEALMPTDAVYEQNYKVSSIFEQLQQDAAEFPDTMEQRFGAWAGLMSLCRLVFDGGGTTADYLPARHGQLFDPEPYPWLETPWISDGAVYAVLGNLLIVNSERISYRALDVEQIGSVYEGIMGYKVERCREYSIGVKSKPQGSRRQLTTVISLCELLKIESKTRAGWLDEQAQCTLPENSSIALAKSRSEAELLEALSPRIDHDLFDGVQEAGRLVFQPTEERRRSGSHYTPRSLTRPIVEEALRPWLEAANNQPRSTEILELKICDPAMGSGAFLVECCRYLAELLEQAWSREGFPVELQPGGMASGEEPLVYARRIIAQRCLYGVDKNPFAVNLARLSVWLVSLSRDVPFTFIDHALKVGDSLVGASIQDLDYFDKLGQHVQGTLFHGNTSIISGKASEDRMRSFGGDTRDDDGEELKRKALAQINDDLEPARIKTGLYIAAFFNAKTPKEAKTNEQVYSTLYRDSLNDEGACEEVTRVVSNIEQVHGVKPFGWHIEFPEVFARADPGFDVFVGNPPFLGTRLITLLGGGPKYLEWLKDRISKFKGHIDLSAFFFLRCNELLRSTGTLGFIATSNISRGDNRSLVLLDMIGKGSQIYSVLPDMPWPGEAAVVVSVLHIAKSAKNRALITPRINGNNVSSINSFLLDGPEPREPQRLVENIGLAFEGTHLGGNGFIIDAIDLEFLGKNPANLQVVKRLIGGDEVNDNLESGINGRKVIAFGSMSLEEASRYPEVLDIVRERVKPKRDIAADNGPGNHGRKYWWQHTLRADPLYAAIANLRFCLVKTKVSRYHIISTTATDAIFNNSVHVFPFESLGAFAVLQSNVHRIWSARYCSRRGATVTYSVKDGFDTYPFPVGWLSNDALMQVGTTYLEARRSIQNELGIGLTTLYSLVNNPECDDSRIGEFRLRVEELDLAVLNAYGFDVSDADHQLVSVSDDGEKADEGRRKKQASAIYTFPPEAEEDILGKLLSLNNSRAENQPKEGVSFKSKGYEKPRSKSSARKAPSVASTNQDLLF
jgi:hypothetical protein